jgi:DNA-binding MarR family transcriptional regulator
MSSPAQLVQIMRQFMDVAMHRSMRERAHFAKATGLSMTQFGILMQLHYRGNCGITDISERFDITTPAASQLVDKVAQSGLIERSEDPSDRRVKHITLSPKGKAMIEKGTRERYRWVDELVTHLNAAEREKVAEALGILNRAVKELDQSQ